MNKTLEIICSKILLVFIMVSLYVSSVWLGGGWALWLDKFKTVQIQKNQHRFNVLAYACLKWTSYSHPFGMALMWDHSKYFPNPSCLSIDTLRNQRSSLSQLFGIPNWNTPQPWLSGLPNATRRKSYWPLKMATMWKKKYKCTVSSFSNLCVCVCVCVCVRGCCY